MKIAYWVIIIMNITLLLILWLYIYDVYIQRRFTGFEYATHIFHSDAAIPIIGLGVLLNTGALIYFLLSFRKGVRSQDIRYQRTVPPDELEKMSRVSEIRHLERELEEIRNALETLKRPHFPGDES